MVIKVNLLVKSCLRNEKKEYNIKGIYYDNKIKFQESNTITIINLNDSTLERIKDKETIYLDFKNNVCIIKNYELKFKIKVIKIKVLEKYFYVNYQIENDCFELEIKII